MRLVTRDRLTGRLTCHVSVFGSLYLVVPGEGLASKVTGRKVCLVFPIQFDIGTDGLFVVLINLCLLVS